MNQGQFGGILDSPIVDLHKFNVLAHSELLSPPPTVRNSTVALPEDEGPPAGLLLYDH